MGNPFYANLWQSDLLYVKWTSLQTTTGASIEKAGWEKWKASRKEGRQTSAIVVAVREFNAMVQNKESRRTGENTWKVTSTKTYFQMRLRVPGYLTVVYEVLRTVATISKRAVVDDQSI
ncbi:hypothetical protein ABG067_003683 [Albugo candida]